MKTMPAQPQFLRASFTGRPVKVDRDKEILYGYVVAQEGPFKSQGRGQFDAQSLSEIAAMGNASRGGLKSRFTHPDASSDGLGKFLGRAREFTIGTTVNADGKTVRAVRADLHFDPSAHKTPSGDLADYVMSLAETDPAALSSSLVLKPREFVPNGRGGFVELKDGEEPPPGVTPLWRPKRLHASDLVDVGDAVDGLLSANLSPELLRWDNAVRLGGQVIDALFDGQPREVIEARVTEYLQRHLDRRFGDDEPAPTPRLDKLAADSRRMAEAVERLRAARMARLR